MLECFLQHTYNINKFRVEKIIIRIMKNKANKRLNKVHIDRYICKLKTK